MDGAGIAAFCHSVLVCHDAGYLSCLALHAFLIRFAFLLSTIYLRLCFCIYGWLGVDIEAAWVLEWQWGIGIYIMSTL